MIDMKQMLLERMTFIEGNKERLIESWIAATGLSPLESCLVQRNEGLETKMWVECHTDRCLTHRDEIATLRQHIAYMEAAIKSIKDHLVESGDLLSRIQKSRDIKA
jgi:hypothetical protein